jgi:hypothetical protein
VRATGRWGTIFVGTPLQEIPQSESLPISTSNDPALLVAAMEAPQQIVPRPADFSLTVTGGGSTAPIPLFPECQRFIESCRKLAEKAQAISQATHGSATLTPPPA